MTLVEETLRQQRASWREITERMSRLTHRDFPPEAPKRILLFGIGSSYFAAKLTALSLLKDKCRARVPVVSCASHEVGLEVIPSKGDWAIAFTHRGTTKWTQKALEIAARAGAFTIQVSAQGAFESPLARLVLNTSFIEKVEPHTIAVTGAICAATSVLLGAKGVEEWDALQSVGDPDLDQMRSWVGEGPSILLGEWEGEWLAREAALKLMEMAALPVRAYGSEEFFHGPRLSLTPQDSIWHFSVAEDLRHSEIAQYEALQHHAIHQAVHRVEVSGASPLSWVSSLVKLQWMALAVALNRGVDPDR